MITAAPGPAPSAPGLVVPALEVPHPGEQPTPISPPETPEIPDPVRPPAPETPPEPPTPVVPPEPAPPQPDQPPQPDPATHALAAADATRRPGAVQQHCPPAPVGVSDDDAGRAGSGFRPTFS